jgi:hypothetical protein
MKGIEDLVSGFRRFQRRYFGEQRELYERLARAGQVPRSMVIGCCDSRAEPALITDCRDPGRDSRLSQVRAPRYPGTDRPAVRGCRALR